jgi:hypothetical protein
VHQASEASEGTRRLTGVVSALGGAAWVAACLVHNTLPQGCIGDQCDHATMRGSTPVATTLFVAAGLLLVASGLGLFIEARRRARLGRPGAAAVVTGALGLLLLAAATVVSTVDNDWAGMPGLVLPGIILLAVGLVLVAVVVLRARVVPVWVAALLLATAVLVPFANEQTSRILLAVPFGLAWLVLGLTLVRGPRVTDQPSGS